MISLTLKNALKVPVPVLGHRVINSCYGQAPERGLIRDLHPAPYPQLGHRQGTEDGKGNKP